VARRDRDPRHPRRRGPRPPSRDGASDHGLRTTRAARWALPVVIAGSALIAASASVGDIGWQRGFDRTSSIATPIAPTDTAIASGRATYRERCQPCHGDRGRGDGPLAAALEPRPADLVLHVPQHTDGELFYFVSRGVPQTAMPVWGDVLTVTQRWELVAYLRELAEGRP
jgi:mono/diheme cytochrome c family protein